MIVVYPSCGKASVPSHRTPESTGKGREQRGYFSKSLSPIAPSTAPVILVCRLQRTFKCLLLADERSRYAYERKPLRVTDPTGVQRSTCRL